MLRYLFCSAYADAAITLLREVRLVSRRKKVRCYLSAPSMADTRAVREALRELNVSVENIELLPPSGESLPNEIRKRVEKADFICGVLLEEKTDARNYVENVLFELGVAVGCDRPIFIVAEHLSLIPFSLASYPYVLGAMHNDDVLRFHLDTFLKRLSLPKAQTANKQEPVAARLSAADSSDTVRVRRNVEAEIETIRQGLGERPSELDLSRTVANALRITGANVAVEATLVENLRPDVVAWLPRPIGDLGSAVLVEAKSTLARPATTVQAIEQVGRYMSAAGIRVGLLVALDASDEIQVRITSAGYIFVLSINALLTLISQNRLPKGLIEARNRFVHTGA